MPLKAGWKLSVAGNHNQNNPASTQVTEIHFQPEKCLPANISNIWTSESQTVTKISFRKGPHVKTNLPRLPTKYAHAEFSFRSGSLNTKAKHILPTDEMSGFSAALHTPAQLCMYSLDLNQPLGS